MVFSSPIFLFGFLPAVLALYYVSPKLIRNYILVAISLIFYAWGEVFYSVIMLVSITVNYVVGRYIGQALAAAKAYQAKVYLTVGVVVNVALLVSFKYANFITDNVNVVLHAVNLGPIDLAPVHLPLGISFFTFQAISYISDVYRREVPAQRSLVNLALYISLFPQLIAGPIVRYQHIASQIIVREHSLSLFASGVERFILGLAKKMLVANTLGEVADNAFSLSGGDLTMPLAWLGIIAYAGQIYFDFSGYSDMAIGLGRMFGFTFHENFNYPYISRSIQEFWRRWHISLSTWFKDYVYIPLGGNRVSPVRVYVNLFAVFLLTGVWHGASWNFVLWGLFHGLFMIIERQGLASLLQGLWRPVQHAYVLLVVLCAWVLFRADNLTQAIDYLAAMFNVGAWHTTQFQYDQVLSSLSLYAFMVAAVCALPVYPALKRLVAAPRIAQYRLAQVGAQIVKLAYLSALLWYSMLFVASSTYNPFIYFRF